MASSAHLEGGTHEDPANECDARHLGNHRMLALWITVPAAGQSGAKNGEWRDLRRRPGSTRYSPLDQINAANFNKLEVAWRFKTDSLGPRPEYQFEGTPLMVHGVLYTTAGTRRAVVALDAATGELLWMHSENEGARGRQRAPAAFRPRTGLLDRRQGRTNPLRHARLPADRAGRQDRHSRRRLRQERRRRSEAGRRSGDRSGHRRGRAALDAGRREERRDRRRGALDGRSAEEQEEREGLRPRIRRADRQAPVDLPHHPAAGRVRHRHLGERFLVLHRQHRRVGPDLGG